MTFTEAALEVLRSAGEPLHFKKITELAIERNLLSHVGKTPEVTMSSRLATLVKKDRSESRIVKVRPGVFAFREPSMTRDKEAAAADDTHPSVEAEAAPATPERPQLPGLDVFPAEADDDDPILAGLDEASSAAEDSSGRRRRRRRRRGKSGEEGVSAGNGNGNGHAEPREPREPRETREPVARESRDHRENRDHRSGQRDHRDRDRDRDRDRTRTQAAPAIDLHREPGDGDLLGKDLADAAYHVLSRAERSPANFARVADMLVRRGRMTGAPDALAPTVAAALRADVARATQRGGRSRFRIAQQRVTLTEWLLPREALRHEEQASHSAERQRDQVRRAFVTRLIDLPVAGFAEIIATWLNAEGVTGLRAVRRPSSSGRELHFAGTRRRGTEETRLAIVVQRAGRDLDRETVIATRGSLHHYANATSTWLITTGRVTSGAREEAVAEGAAPCALFDGVELAQAMERAGIGIRLHHVPLCELDLDLLEALGDTGDALAVASAESRDRDRSRRDERPRGRERERERERFRGGRDQQPVSSAAASASGNELPGDVEGEGEGEGDLEEGRETDIFELRKREAREETETLASDEDVDQSDEESATEAAAQQADEDDEDDSDEDETAAREVDEDDGDEDEAAARGDDEDDEDDGDEGEDSEDDENDER